MPQLPLEERYPNRAKTWKLKSTTLQFGRLPAQMGIVNVTPDSFSDGGKFAQHEVAIEHGLKLAQDGAAILDVGGESTRPNADPVTESEELRRVIPVVQGLSERSKIPISIDTSKAKVAEEAVAAGAEIINDVTGLEGDARMLDVALATRAGICAMHMRGNPKTMLKDEFLQYDDLVRDIGTYLKSRLDTLVDAGIDRERICLDPGIGFAKTSQQSLNLLAAVGDYHEYGAPLLVGHSKKGFLAKVIDDLDADRTLATVGVSLSLAVMGVQVIRLHDVLSAQHALLSFAAAGGVNGMPTELE